MNQSRPNLGKGGQEDEVRNTNAKKKNGRQETRQAARINEDDEIVKIDPVHHRDCKIKEK